MRLHEIKVGCWIDVSFAAHGVRGTVTHLDRVVDGEPRAVYVDDQLGQESWVNLVAAERVTVLNEEPPF